MSRLRAFSPAVAFALCAVVLAGCATVPGQVNSFDLKSHKYPDRTYGPFKYADGTEVAIGKSSFTVVLDADLASTCCFKLKSHKFPDRVYGPFRCRPGEKIDIGKSSFTVSAVY